MIAAYHATDGSNRNTSFCLHVASRYFAMTSANAPAEHVTLLISIFPTDDAQFHLSVRLSIRPTVTHVHGLKFKYASIDGDVLGSRWQP